MWVGEAEEVSTADEFWESHEAGRAASGLIDEVVPFVDVVLPEGGEALEDVMRRRVRLGV